MELEKTRLVFVGMILLCNIYSVCASNKQKQIALEPTITRKESKQIKSAFQIFDKHPRTAIEQLRTQTGPKASAALDFALATMLAKMKHFAQSIKSLNTALKKFPSFQRAWLLLAWIKMRQGKTVNAINPIRKALQLGGNQSRAFKFLAYCHLRNGDAVAAESAYRQILLLEPKNKKAIAGLARSLLMQERAKDAVPLLRILCKNTPRKAEYWKLRANIAISQDKKHRAIILLECARRLSKIDQQSLLILGDLYFNERLYKKATSCYFEASTRGEFPIARRIRYAEALLDVKQSLLAKKLVGRKRPKDENHLKRFYIVYAKIALARQNIKSAKRNLNAALRVCPMDGDALLMLAHVLKKKNN